MRVFALLLLLGAQPLAASGPDWVSTTAGAGESFANWHGQANVRALEIELGRALSPRTDAAVLVTPMTFHQPRSWFGDLPGEGHEDVRAITVALLLRRRFNSDSARLQFHGEISSGPMWSERPVPAATSHFNFATQFGAGITLMPESRVSIVAGYRFLHISNGGYSPRNPGLNVSAVVIGMRYNLQPRAARRG